MTNFAADTTMAGGLSCVLLRPRFLDVLQRMFQVLELTRLSKAAICLFGSLICFSCFTSPKAVGQSATAEVRGVVHDQTDAIVPGAKVTATQVKTGVTTTVTTTDAGIFDFVTLAVGEYTVAVESSGFETYRQTGVVLTVGQHLTINVGLKVGSAVSSIEIAAATASVDSTTPTEQSVVDEKVVTNLPLNGRNPATLQFTVAGVTDTTLNLSSTGNQVKEPESASPNQTAPSVHGARPGGTYFSLDGANNTDPLSVIGGPFPNPDATSEFSVVTGTYGAQYVSAPGGAINIVSRSGTNNFHGSAFEFIRNGYFNARNALSTQPDVLKRNQFGFAAGGPIVKDRLFIFGTYQATPVHDSSTQTGFLPTAAQRAGNFGTFTVPVSPSAKKMFQYLPFGDPATGYLSYQQPERNNEQQGLIKLDYNFGNHRTFARGFYDRYTDQGSGATAAAGVLAAHQPLNQPWESYAVGDTWNKGAWILQSLASYTRALATDTESTNPFTYSNLGINNLNGETSNPAFAYVLVSSGFGVNPGTYEQNPRKVIELSENVYRVMRKHQFSFGATYRHMSFDEYNLSGQNPILIYAGVNSLLDGLYGIIPGATFSPMADFVMGEPYIFYQQDGYFIDVRGFLFGAYAEDNYKITNNLVLTGGVRWDPFTSFSSDHNRITCFVPGAQSQVYPNSLPGLIYPGDTGCSKNALPSTYGVFEPRVGLAYSADGGRTAVRLGYGMYDLQVPLNTWFGFSNQPFARSYFQEQPFISQDNAWASMGIANPFQGGFHNGSYIPPKNVTFQTGLTAASFSQSYKPGYVEQWSFSVQQLLSPKDSLDIAYIGTAGTHLTMGEDLNTPIYGSGATTTNEQQRRPYQSYGNVYQLATIGTSSYNGMDVTYKHTTNSLSVNSGFTWGHAIDDSSAFTNVSTITIPNTNHNFRRATSDFDQNLIFRTTAVYNLPDIFKSNRFANEALGSWSISGLGVMDAGQPMSVGDGSDNSNTGTGLDLADRVPGVPVFINKRLNINAFTDNAQGTWGDSGRNKYRSLSYKNVDIAAQKTFPIEKEYSILFRAESFNVLNHANLWGANTAYSAGSTSFGQYLNARAPRIMQFSLKFSF